MSYNLRYIKDFPKKGINFADITPLLITNFRDIINDIEEMFYTPDIVVGIEARGFIIGSALAYNMNIGFVPIRKAGKLPYKTLQEKSQKEYGEDILEIHQDAIKKGQKVIIVDDVLATGGTLVSAIKLVERLGGIVDGIACMVEITELRGRNKLEGYNVHTLIKI